MSNRSNCRRGGGSGLYSIGVVLAASLTLSEAARAQDDTAEKSQMLIDDALDWLVPEKITKVNVRPYPTINIRFHNSEKCLILPELDSDNKSKLLSISAATREGFLPFRFVLKTRNYVKIYSKYYSCRISDAEDSIMDFILYPYEDKSGYYYKKNDHLKSGWSLVRARKYGQEEVCTIFARFDGGHVGETVVLLRLRSKSGPIWGETAAVGCVLAASLVKSGLVGAVDAPDELLLNEVYLRKLAAKPEWSQPFARGRISWILYGDAFPQAGLTRRQLERAFRESDALRKITSVVSLDQIKSQAPLNRAK